MKNILLIFLLISQASVLSATSSSTSSSENGFILSTSQASIYIVTTIFNTKKMVSEQIITNAKTGGIISHRTMEHDFVASSEVDLSMLDELP